MSQLTTNEKKAKELGTLDVQNLIYKKYLETFRLRHGKTFDELLKIANDPKRYSKAQPKNKETTMEEPKQ